jgi:hypothetical protein
MYKNIASIELIKVNGRGPNALDIFIAFYIGRYFDSIKESKIIIWNRFYCILELLSQNQAHDCREQYAQWEAFYSINHSKTFRFMIPS